MHTCTFVFAKMKIFCIFQSWQYHLKYWRNYFQQKNLQCWLWESSNHAIIKILFIFSPWWMMVHLFSTAIYLIVHDKWWTKKKSCNSILIVFMRFLSRAMRPISHRVGCSVCLSVCLSVLSHLAFFAFLSIIERQRIDHYALLFLIMKMMITCPCYDSLKVEKPN